MSNVISAIRVLILVSALALAGCGDGKARNGALGNHAVGTNQHGLEKLGVELADSAWAEMTSWSDAPARNAGESSLAHFLRVAELSAQRRRDLGREFWASFPDDPRRYSWLLMAASIYPYYPSDLDAWVSQEIDPTVQTRVTVDADAVNQWGESYASMRTEFWTSNIVSDEQRRHLWASEIYGAVKSAHIKKLSGGEPDVRPVLDEFVEFSKAYSAPFSIVDESGYNDLYRTLWSSLTSDISGAFSWDEASFSALLECLAATENQFFTARRLQEGADDDSDVSMVDTLLSLLNKNEELPPSVRRVSPSGMAEVELERLYWIWLRLTEPAGRLSRSYEGRVAWFHYHDIYARKLRSLGAELWNAFPPSDEMSSALWLHDTVYAPPSYAQDFVAALHYRASGDEGGFEVNEEAIVAWSLMFGEVQQRIETAYAKSELGWLQDGIVFEKVLITTPTAWRSSHNRAVVTDMMSEIEALYTEFGDAEKATEWANRVIQDRDKFGLSDEDLRSFTSRLAGLGPPELKQPAEVIENLIFLRNTPFDLAASTSDGQPFDMEDMRGYCVLVDHWTTTCASCIAAMPKIKAVYEAYRDKGFKVASVVYDGTEYPTKLDRITTELQLPWPIVVADDLEAEIAERYGYNGYPQYMLLKRNGTLFADTSDLQDIEVDLPRLLDEMLELESSP